MEPKRVYRAARGEVPEGEYTIPLGEAKVVREAHGTQVTVLAWGAMVHTALEAGEQGAAQGFDLEVIDLRTLLPLRHRHDPGVGAQDRARSWSCTRRRGPAASAPSWRRRSRRRRCCSLEAPILRVTGFDTPFPYTLEHEYLPDANRILDAVERVVSF